MSIVFFSDIDDTLINSTKKCINHQQLAVSAYDKEGEPASYSSAAQQLLIGLCQQHIFIPVTGRNKAALDRVSIAAKSYQVIDHGAIILNEQGELDAQWRQLLLTEPLDWQQILEDYVSQVLKMIDAEQLALRCRVISDYGFACYISIKGDEQDLKKLRLISEQFCTLAENARVHVNGHNMALLPPYACKKRAVEFLQKRYLALNAQSLFVGLGDSNSDLDFMRACHFQMIPQQSQINTDFFHESS